MIPNAVRRGTRHNPPLKTTRGRVDWTRPRVVVWWWMQSGPAPCARCDAGLRFVGRARPVRRAISLPTTVFPSRVARDCARAVPNSLTRLLAEGSLSRSLAERGIQPCGGSLSLAVPVSLSNHVPRRGLTPQPRTHHQTQRSEQPKPVSSRHQFRGTNSATCIAAPVTVGSLRSRKDFRVSNPDDSPRCAESPALPEETCALGTTASDSLWPCARFRFSPAPSPAKSVGRHTRRKTTIPAWRTALRRHAPWPTRNVRAAVSTDKNRRVEVPRSTHIMRVTLSL